MAAVKNFLAAKQWTAIRNISIFDAHEAVGHIPSESQKTWLIGERWRRIDIIALIWKAETATTISLPYTASWKNAGGRKPFNGLVTYVDGLSSTLTSNWKGGKSTTNPNRITSDKVPALVNPPDRSGIIFASICSNGLKPPNLVISP